MSETTSTTISTTPTTGGQPAQTKDQPHFSLANIIDHPGSSYAGASALIVGIGQFMSANAYPTTSAGWLAYIAAALLAIGGALGK